MANTSNLDANILQAALEGLEAQKAEIDEHIARIRVALGQKRTGPARSVAAAPAATPAVVGKKRRRRRLSAAGRANIIAALKKRWAAKKTKA